MLNTPVPLFNRLFKMVSMINHMGFLPLEGATMHDHHAYLNSQEPLPIMPLPLDPPPVITEAEV